MYTVVQPPRLEINCYLVSTTTTTAATTNVHHKQANYSPAAAGTYAENAAADFLRW